MDDGASSGIQNVHFVLFGTRQDAKTHVELCTDKLKACKIIYSDAMCKLELLSNSIHTKRLNQNDHSNNEYSHSNNNNNNNNMDDYVIMKSFSKQYESIQYTNEYSNNQFMKDNTLNKSNNDCLNVTIVDHLNMDNHNHNTDNDNSTIVNGVLLQYNLHLTRTNCTKHNRIMQNVKNNQSIRCQLNNKTVSFDEF
ncbi:unnamed protein product [Schistosoma mattheei]|uniref:Uncharacterized protein n=1 Tax=Schistosoma mattheei TaxID=31246 RepID=A0A183PAF8_9TREM|nr:unnamed protein product [Schistosoma mattheei]